MPQPPGSLAVAAAYFLIYVVWGSTYYFIGVCLHDFPPFMLGTVRFAVAGLALLAVCRLRGERLLRRGLIFKSAVCGIILLFVDQGVIMFAQRYVSSSLVAIMASSTALWIMLLDIPQWRRNFRSVSTMAGIVLGFLGVAMLYLEQLNMQRPGGSHYEYGVLLLIGGCISWACGTLYSNITSAAMMTADCRRRHGRCSVRASCLPCAQDCRAISAVCSYPQYQPFHGFRWHIL